MRKALNEDPRVQMAVFAVVAIFVVFFLFTTVMKKDPAPPAATDPTAVATTPATDPAATDPAPTDPGPTDPAASDPVKTPADPGTAAAPSTPITPSAPSAGTDPGAASGLLPGKGLPKDVLVAYARNQAIALLVVDPRGLSDEQLKTFTEPLRSRKDVTLFVVDSKNIGDYYRITAGVSVDRVPALVVIRPRKLTDDAPTATVSYGFRGPKSVDQAVDDALYDGAAVPSYP
jgi:hypothetical protein